MTARPGWFLFNGIIRLDVETGAPGVQVPGWRLCQREPDGAAQGGDITAGPIASVRLPKRICVGTHSCWADIGKLAG